MKPRLRWTRWTGIAVMVPLTIIEWLIFANDGNALTLGGAALVTLLLGFNVWQGMTWPD